VLANSRSSIEKANASFTLYSASARYSVQRGNPFNARSLRPKTADCPGARQMKTRILAAALGILALLVYGASLPAQDSDWPRTIPLEQGLITVYEPQVDELHDDIIRFRAALAYRPTAGAEPVFGVGWFESPVEVDQANRRVRPLELKVTETRFPEGTSDVQAALEAAFAQESTGWNPAFSLDELQADLNIAQAETNAIHSRNSNPPRIVYRDHPALLVSIDGDPVLRDIEDSNYQAVINTPYPLIYDGRQYFLNAASGVWYRADRATGPYRFDPSPPAAISAIVNAPDTEATKDPEAEPITAATAPEIIVSTEPTELIVTEGPAAFVPLVDDLLVLQNSQDDVFMHVSSQQFYIVLAGRWYYSDTLNGPWAYRASDALPAAFANIPQESGQADSRVYVAGTPEAREAVLDAQIPQTAAVERGTVDIEVDYDGEPSFSPVDGTDMTYADNTGSTVLQSDRLYYLVEDGVWYVSVSPEGPWEVATERPDQVDGILPSSPAYNTKYVYVYDSTPRVVYVGYTPGYYGSYIYRDTIIYGTGWHYRPWVSPYHYFPRAGTWGFHAFYNPWNGWSFGLGWGWGPFSFSYFWGGYWHHHHHWHHRHFGRWGPGGHRYRPVHHGGAWAHNDYRRGRGMEHGSRRYERDRNLYRDSGQRAGVASSRDRAYAGRTSIRPVEQAPLRQSDLRTKAEHRDRAYAGRTSIRSVEQVSLRQSDLRAKAEFRDSDLLTGRTGQVADNGGMSRSRPAGSPATYRQQPSQGVSNNALQRPAGSPATYRQQPSRGVSNNTMQRPARFVTPQTTPIQQRAPTVQAQNRAGDIRLSQRVSPVSKAPAPQPRVQTGRGRALPQISAPQQVSPRQSRPRTEGSTRGRPSGREARGQVRQRR
jgi:hypothetical protein